MPNETPPSSESSQADTLGFQPLPITHFEADSHNRKKKATRWLRRSIAYTAILMLIGWCIYIFTTPQERPLLVDSHKAGKLIGLPETQNIGTITMDTKVTTTFLLQNVGGKPLKINKVEPSCGCTAATPDKTVLKPGETTKLHLTLDTTNKLGDVRKTIDLWLSQATPPQLTLTLFAHVEAPPMTKTHLGAIKPKDRLALFKGECATCHVDKGVGKVGEALFVADCAMCHGLGGKGTFAGPGLLAKHRKTSWNHADYAKHLKEVITHGASYNPAMPPFGKVHGGPLTEDDITSLVQYLKIVSMTETSD